MPPRIFMAREETAPGFEVSNDRLTLLLETNATGETSAPLSFWKILGPLTIMLTPLCALCMNSDTWVAAHVFTTWFTEYLKAHCWHLLLRKKIPSKILVLVVNAPGRPGTLMEMDRINIVFMSANITSICSPWIKESFQLSSLIY